MKHAISFCGLDCSACPAYVATRANDLKALEAMAEAAAKQLGRPVNLEETMCDGCQQGEGHLVGYCHECAMRACGMKNQYPNCAYCPKYACEHLQKFFNAGFAGSTTAKNSLEAIRASINKG